MRSGDPPEAGGTGGWTPWKRVLLEGDGYEPGDVKMNLSEQIPDGWKECNGQALSRTAYAALFAKIGTTWGAGDGSTTFNVPDARGEFWRGYDNGRGVDDPGRTLGSWQEDAFQAHEHLQINGNNGHGTSSPGYSLGANNPSPTGGIVDGGQGTPRYASETRPRNLAVMYIIKY